MNIKTKPTRPADKWAQENGWRSKSYKLRLDIVEKFKEACARRNVSQSAVLTSLMLDWVNKDDSDINIEDYQGQIISDNSMEYYLEMSNEEFSFYVKQMRKEYRITQASLAYKCNTSPSVISTLENLSIKYPAGPNLRMRVVRALSEIAEEEGSK